MTNNDDVDDDDVDYDFRKPYFRWTDFTEKDVEVLQKYNIHVDACF